MVERMRQIGSVAIHQGDCLDVLPTLEERFTGVLSDPPYGLFFMSKSWDKGVPGIPFWSAIRERCLPGAHMLAFGGTRTYHRQTCAIEDSGWIIRDCLMWVYGSGFPKSLDLSKAIDKSLGVEREVVGLYDTRSLYDGSTRSSVGTSARVNHIPLDKGTSKITKPATPQSKLWDGYGTAIKPAYEPVVLAMNPREGSFVNNALEHGCGGLNIDGTRIGTDAGWTYPNGAGGNGFHGGVGRPPDGSRVESVCSTQGRWPANILIDDSPEVVGLFPDTASGAFNGVVQAPTNGASKGSERSRQRSDRAADKGSAARFFYCAKASRSEREAGCERLPVQSRADLTGRAEGSAGLDNPRASTRSTRPIRNTHPTVKPLALMRYLLRLVTQPQRNLVLDPFAGSGTTGVACALAGVPCVLIEQDAHHFDICCARVQWSHDLRARLGCTPPLDLSPYQRPPAAAAAEAQLDLWSS